MNSVSPLSDVPFYGLEYPPKIESLILEYADSLQLADRVGRAAHDIFYHKWIEAFMECERQIFPFFVSKIPTFHSRKDFVDEIHFQLKETGSAAHMPDTDIHIREIAEYLRESEEAIKVRDLCIIYNQITEKNLFLPADVAINNLPIGPEKAQHIDDWMQANKASLNEVEKLDLSKLALKTLPAQLKYFSALEELNVNDNQLDNLAGENLPSNLKELHANKNKIRTLVGVNFPVGLEVLSLDDNQIESLAETSWPSTLKELGLVNNQIITLVSANFPASLELLSMAGNRIESLVGVNWPPNLEDVGFNNNQIATLVGITWPSKLKQLFLVHNKIKTLLDAHFPETLVRLSLEDNSINSLAGVELPAGLLWFSLNNNRLETIENFNRPSSKLNFSFTGNPVLAEPLF